MTTMLAVCIAVLLMSGGSLCLVHLVLSRKFSAAFTTHGWALYGLSTAIVFSGLAAGVIAPSSWLGRLTELQGWLLFAVFVAIGTAVEIALTRNGVSFVRPRGNGAQPTVQGLTSPPSAEPRP